MLQYLKATKDLVLTLDARNCNIIKWYANGAHTVHPDMKGHSGITLKLGKGHPMSISTKQKLNTRSSTKNDVVTTYDALPQILWTNNFIKVQGWDYEDTILYQDNKSAILMENNGRASCSKRTNEYMVFLCKRLS